MKTSVSCSPNDDLHTEWSQTSEMRKVNCCAPLPFHWWHSRMVNAAAVYRQQEANRVNPKLLSHIGKKKLKYYHASDNKTPGSCYNLYTGIQIRRLLFLVNMLSQQDQNQHLSQNWDSALHVNILIRKTVTTTTFTKQIFLLGWVSANLVWWDASSQHHANKTHSLKENYVCVASLLLLIHHLLIIELEYRCGNSSIVWHRTRLAAICHPRATCFMWLRRSWR